MADLSALRGRIRDFELRSEESVVQALLDQLHGYRGQAAVIERQAAALVEQVRARSAPGIMESFLGEYGLSTQEGVALMCLAEALLRVPDDETIDALISDKIAPSSWGKHLGRSSSSLVNASTWALMLTGSVLSEAEEPGLIASLRGVVRRLGEPVVRTAVAQAMKELGRQFVLGRDIDEAMVRANGMEAKGYSYSYDMLGEAARTDADAKRYHIAYSDAIASIGKQASQADVRRNPGISIKLSALHPRYETAQKDLVMEQLMPRARALALIAKSANIGLNIDAEEADRLDLSLDIIEAMFADPGLSDWPGFGVVVQAYSRRAAPVLDWLYTLSHKYGRSIMVRLVKGAYWDSEIKRAQVLGLKSFPVFTRKATTDVSYLACSAKLLAMTDRIFPQFATHNAHSVAAILAMADDPTAFEFQRLHGMGEALHDAVLTQHGSRCRIYAPVGAHQDLLAYLVRRLLENGANSSFVNQIVDSSIPAKEIARDPLQMVDAAMHGGIANIKITPPAALFGAERHNALGLDLTNPLVIDQLAADFAKRRGQQFTAKSTVAGSSHAGTMQIIRNPAVPDEIVGEAFFADVSLAQQAAQAAQAGAVEWAGLAPEIRRQILAKIGDLYEQEITLLMDLAIREAGKSWADALAEVREAIDFCRYYALQSGTVQKPGVIVCISPWNFPLAIFTGQIVGALAAGNAVIAKPAEQTPLIAAEAVRLMHQAGVPQPCLQMVLGDGAVIGSALISSSAIDGVCFTGSTETAKLINRSMASHLSPDKLLIAETGGLNAMIVDSTALPEQAVRDIVISAFQSAGQRCSALRMLYVQTDVEERLLVMLQGAMDCLRLGNPREIKHDIGPVIDAEAKTDIDAYVAGHRQAGRVLKQLDAPTKGYFVAPTLIKLNGIEELPREIFGPVLHVASFEADRLGEVVERINARGFGLTLGIHSRIDDRVETIVERARVGNIYVNRNQIGAVVGSQPFGGEGLSGTGPKAGGPAYVDAMRQRPWELATKLQPAPSMSFAALQAAVDQARSAISSTALAERELPGPTGESNKLSHFARGVVLCAAHSQVALDTLVSRAADAGNVTVAAAFEPAWLETLNGIDAVACDLTLEKTTDCRQALARRDGPILPLLLPNAPLERYQLERHLCIDTTAAGGNASLLALAD